MKINTLKSSAQLLVDQDSISANDQSIWSMIATAQQVEDLVRQIKDLHESLGLEFDALQFMGISTAQATPQQVLDLINQIEGLQAQAQQKRAA